MWVSIFVRPPDVMLCLCEEDMVHNSRLGILSCPPSGG